MDTTTTTKIFDRNKEYDLTSLCKKIIDFSFKGVCMETTMLGGEDIQVFTSLAGHLPAKGKT